MDALRRSGSVVVVRDANHHREPGIIESYGRKLVTA
jgi:hypothetical protein